MKNKITTYLNQRLNNIFKEQTFDDWCESSIDKISPNKVPVDLRDFFTPRKISSVKIKHSLSFPAKISKKDNSFVIYLDKRTNWNTSKFYRFYIAHEIAHTFQYEFTNDLIVEQSFFLPGTGELEFFCNRLARSILLPRKLITPYLDNLYNIDDSRFSLKFINVLALKFNVKHTVLLQRIINDLDFYGDLILLRFIKFSTVDAWGLIERYLSNKYNYNKKYFIPYMNQDKSREFVTRIPSCGKKLNNFLNKADLDLKVGEEKKIKIHSDLISDKPIKWFMRNFHMNDLKIVLISKVKSQDDIIINLLISLDKKHVAQHVI